MSIIRLIPKWCNALVPFLLVLAVIATTLGCGGSPSPAPVPPPVPPLSQEAGIRGIELSQGNLMPAFGNGVRNYSTTIFTGLTNFRIKTDLVDDSASLFVNGEPKLNGQWVSLDLAPGTNTVTITTVSEDLRNSDCYTVTVNSLAPNVKVWVLDGLGGTHVEDTVLSLRDTEGNLLQGNIALPSDKNGSVFLGLDVNKKYNIYAKGKNSAQSCFANFDPSREDTVVLYCLPGWASPYVSEAPIITDVAFSTTNSTTAIWKHLSNGQNTAEDTRANMNAVLVTAISKNPIIDAVGAQYPMMINVNDVASRAITNWTYYYGDEVEAGTPYLMNNVGYFRTTYRYDLVPEYYPSAENWLSVVVYDIANNRTEQRIYMTFTSGDINTNDPNISSVTPEMNGCQAQTYGLSENFYSIFPVDLPAISPVDGYGATYYTYLSFYPEVSIRGYEVHRSLDGVTFEKISTRHLMGSLSERQTAYDLTPDVKENQWYYYKIKGFNGSSFTRFSNTLRVKPLPTFVTLLDTPAHEAVTHKLWPSFTFKPTNPGLSNADVSDSMTFTLYAKPVDSGTGIFNVMLIVNFDTLDEEGNPYMEIWDDYNYEPMPAYYEDDDGELIPIVRLLNDGTVCIDTDNEVFQYAAYWSVPADWFMTPGAPYEWSIFGQYGGILDRDFGAVSTNAAYYYKEWDTPAGVADYVYNNAFTFGSIANIGLGAPNGFFTLIVAEDAE